MALGDPQLRQEEPGQLGGRDQVGVELEVPRLGREVTDLAELDDARDVQQRVDPLRHRLLGERPGEPVRVGEVTDERASAGVERGQLLRAARVTGQQHGLVTALQKTTGDSCADAGACAGDDMSGHAPMIALH